MLEPTGGVYTFTLSTVPEEDRVEIPVEFAGHEHVWSNWTVTTPATCAKAAVESRTCTVDGCGAVQTRTVGDPLGHDYVAAVTRPATCTDEEITTWTCSRCGASYEIYGEALGHAWSEPAWMWNGHERATAVSSRCPQAT